ncbi:MAG: S-layer homology domain-containing protein [Clostridia bacterium]|nr:S-layer homology domain-containing protein [Clostridia bacterium]
MKKLQKGLSVLLAFVLILSTVCTVQAADKIKVSLSSSTALANGSLDAKKDNKFTVYFGVDALELDGHSLNTYKFTIWYDPDYLSLISDPIEQMISPNGYALYNEAETESKTIGGKLYNGYTYSYTSYADGFLTPKENFYPLTAIKFSADKLGETKIYITEEETLLLPVHSDSAPETLDFSLGKSNVAVTIEKASDGGGGGGPSGGGPSGGPMPKPSYVTVTFIMGDTKQDLAVTAGGYAAAPTPVERENYTFDGWYADRAYTTPFDFSKPISANTTVYAKYTFNKPADTPKNPFTDVKEADWFYDSVQYAYKNKLVSGTSDTTFSPEEMLTRGTMVTLLYRMENQPEAPKHTFADVEKDMWYEAPIAWAADEGIVLGTGDGLFAPEEAITREQIAVILYKYAKMKGEDVSKTASLDSYADKSDVSDWATDAMGWALGLGLIKGTSDTTLSPGDNATRAEIVTILMRYLERN